MKRRTNIILGALAVIILLFAGLCIGLCIVSMSTPEPTRTELDYFSEGAVIFVLLLSVGFIAGACGLIFNRDFSDTKITDEDIEEIVNQKANELLEDAIIKKYKP